MVTERGACNTIQGPWKKPTEEGLPRAYGCCRGANVGRGMNIECLKGKEPPSWPLRTRLLLAQTSQESVTRGSRTLTSRAHSVSVKMSGSLLLVCVVHFHSFPFLDRCFTQNP